VPIAPAKLQDINNLLVKHFGKNWREMDLDELAFYKPLLPSYIDENLMEGVDDDNYSET